MVYEGYPFPITLTEDIYWASQPDEVAALRGMDPTARPGAAMDLALKGFAIDLAIHAWAWDPVLVMAIRKSMGMTWAPSALQPQAFPISNGLNLPVYDPNKPPAGSIKVSVDAPDYPPFHKPQPATVVVQHIVGPFVGPDGQGNKVFSYGPLAKATDFKTGDEVTQDGVTYVAHVSMGLMGVTFYFTQK